MTTASLDWDIELAILKTKPIILKIEPKTVSPRSMRPPKRSLTANTPEELAVHLGLAHSAPDVAYAALLAFAARHPGQAKKMPAEWKESLGAYCLFPDDAVWIEVIRVGELIGKHKFIRTPMAGTRKGTTNDTKHGKDGSDGA